MNKMILLLVLATVLTACQTKPAEDGNNQTAPPADAVSDAPKRDVSTPTLVAIDEDIQPYADAVDASKKSYESDNNDANRDKLFQAYVAFGDYMQYESGVSPRQGKYHRALIEYRHALDLDPDNNKVLAEIAQIEDIYRSMGRPIPGEE
ncbi:MAG: lipoprotein [Bacteroidetes bacterium]|nr:lipoprotein [Bacteroidota bacterium]